MLASAKRAKIVRAVLGDDYDLSFAFISSAKSLELNRRYRHKNKPANVLSFPLAPRAGEILIDRELADSPERATFLFIHGLLHLKGLRHGSKMEALERELCLRFATHHDPQPRRRTGHRNLRHQIGGY